MQTSTPTVGTMPYTKHTLSSRISTIFVEQDLYLNLPQFQRDEVWPQHMKQGLIKSILKRLYIPHITLAPRILDNGLEAGYWLIDGQQRLSTILAFKAGKFKIGTRYYQDLSAEEQNCFDSYYLDFVVLRGYDLVMLGEQYRNMNQIKPLTSSEKLWANVSLTSEMAMRLLPHEFFSTVYTNTTRKKPFQVALYIIVLELNGGFCHLTTDYLAKHAAGAKDALMTETLSQRITRRLDLICQLYNGIQTGAMAEIIFLYQSILLLETAGYDLENTPPGTLIQWYSGVERQNQDDRQRGFFNLFIKMQDLSQQKNFWMQNLDVLAQLPGLVSPNLHVSMRDIERIKSWIRHHGICQQCNKSVPFAHLDAHYFGYSTGHVVCKPAPNKVLPLSIMSA